MKYTSRIGNQFSEENSHTFTTFNCLKNEKNEDVFSCVDIFDVQQACRLAHNATPVFRKTTEEERRLFLHEIANELQQQKEVLIAMYCKESSLSEARAQSELDRTIFQLKNYGDALLQPNWNRTIESHPDQSHYQFISQLRPIGPVVVFGSSNFPLAYSTAGGDTASAFAAGCPVIVKAHPMHAGTSCIVAECIIKAIEICKLPNGIFSHLLDNGHEVGKELVSNDYVKAVGFTGSIKGGRALMDIAAKRSSPIPVFAEMGSVNPVVFFEDELAKNMSLWIDKFTTSIATDAGQFCTKPGILFVPQSDIGNEFVTELKQQLSFQSPKCHLHPQLFHHYKELVSGLFSWQDVEQPFYSQPVLRVVSAETFLSDYRFHEEFFGPQSIAVHYESEDQLSEMIAKLEGQLTGTIIASPEELLQHEGIIEQLEELAGRIVINSVPTGVVVCDAMVHGGVYPASSDSRFTAVGSSSIYRFLRPITRQQLAIK